MLSSLHAFPFVAAVCLHHTFCLAVCSPPPHVVVPSSCPHHRCSALALGRLLLACPGSASGRSWQWLSRWTEPCHGSWWDGGAKSRAGLLRQVSVGRTSGAGGSAGQRPWCLGRCPRVAGLMGVGKRAVWGVGQPFRPLGPSTAITECLANCRYWGAVGWIPLLPQPVQGFLALGSGCCAQ